MARLRHGTDNHGMHGSMRYIHMRKEGSTAICGRTGMHTTKHHKKVTCQFCLDMIKKGKA